MVTFYFTGIIGSCSTTMRRMGRSSDQKPTEERNYNDNEFTKETLIYTSPVNTKEVLPCLCSDTSLGICELIKYGYFYKS